MLAALLTSSILFEDKKLSKPGCFRDEWPSKNQKRLALFHVLTEPSGRLIRWRLRLSEFDFKVLYRPGRVNQVRDALSRLVRPSRDTKPVEDDIPTFGEHLDPVLVATRGRSSRIGATANHGDVASTNPSHAINETSTDNVGVGRGSVFRYNVPSSSFP